MGEVGKISFLRNILQSALGYLPLCSLLFDIGKFILTKGETKQSYKSNPFWLNPQNLWIILSDNLDCQKHNFTVSEVISELGNQWVEVFRFYQKVSTALSAALIQRWDFQCPSRDHKAHYLFCHTSAQSTWLLFLS